MLFSQRTLSIVLSCAALGLALSPAGCGGGSGGSGGGGSTTTTPTDGRVHPSPDGTHVTEKAACEALTNAQQKQLLAMHCVATGQTCPSFLRSEFKTACMEYDQGSVAGCIEYYSQQGTCDALKTAIDDCVITAYPGTEPAGCPTGGTGGTGGSTGGTGGVGGSTGGTGGSTGGTGGATGGTGGVTSSGGTGGVTSSGGTGGVTSSGGTGGV